MNKRQLREQQRRQLYQLAGRKTSDRSLAVASMIGSLSKTSYGERYREVVASGNWEEIVRYPSPRPDDYVSHEVFAIDYLLSELLSKMSPAGTGADPEVLRGVALAKFADSEGQCRDTNQRLTQEFSRLGSAEFDPIVKSARRKIAKCLGEFSWDEVSGHFRHGKHASTRLSRRKGDLYYKFGGLPDTTVMCETLSKIAISLIKPWQPDELEITWPECETEPTIRWSDRKVNLVVGNRITTVPKTAKTDRVIAIEPCMNMYIQKGIGAVIRSRLRRKGLELNDQRINQRLSRDGSMDGSLATVDLSSASDTISSKVVELLLPPDWYTALNLTRCHYGVELSGNVIRYQKFSTMGNGFTFELESLIFWALCSAVVDNLSLGDKRIGVYGDDLIVSVAAYESLTYTLTRFGFTQNAKKSYATGPFRESCGKHWFNGRDVSPFYIREGIEDVTRELLCVNNFRRWANRVFNSFIPPRVWDVYVALRDFLIPEDWVKDNKIPDGYGDLGLVTSFTEALPQRARHGLEGWECDSLQLSPPPRKLVKARRVNGESLLAKGLMLQEINNPEGSRMPGSREATLYSSLGPEESGGETYSDQIPIDQGKLRLKTSKLLVARWEDVGFPLI